MTLTPGKALFLDKTGHSLDNERRNYWARQIIEFLGLYRKDVRTKSATAGRPFPFSKPSGKARRR